MQPRIYHFAERVIITGRLVGKVMVYTVTPVATERAR
jgi:hypothetical protein